MLGQMSPPEVPPPIMVNTLSPSMYTNTAAGTTLAGPNLYTSVPTLPSLPPWASPEQQIAHQKLSKDRFKLSPAHQIEVQGTQGLNSTVKSFQIHSADGLVKTKNHQR